VGDDRWRGDPGTIHRIVRDIESEGLFEAADVVETHVLTNAYAYPVFELGFERHLETVARFLGRFGNVRSTGRQGAFEYPNMHAAMRMGAGAAEEVLAAVGRRPAI
jgi:protoporphyrinogen oxidase